MDPKEMHGLSEPLGLAVVLSLVRGIFRHESVTSPSPQVQTDHGFRRPARVRTPSIHVNGAEWL
jgi:hypothetical protein